MPKTKSKGRARKVATQPAKKSVVVLTRTEFIQVSQPLKVCRLCESKDGPFQNIFKSDKVTAKIIEELMPFVVAENDELPHKICFRCSAKVEEIYEFIQKCIKTQISLQTALGKKEPCTTKIKTHRSLWEEKLNKSNISNDDICDAVIKKAMEGIKDIPISPFSVLNNKHKMESDVGASALSNETVKIKAEEKMLFEDTKLLEFSKDVINIDSDGNASDEPQLIEKPTKESGVKSKQTNATLRSLRSNFESLSNKGQLQKIKKTTAIKKSTADPTIIGRKIIKLAEADNAEAITNDTAKKNVEKEREHSSKQREQIVKTKINTTQSDQKVCEQVTPKVDVQQPIEEKYFDIMDHVSMIKVNGVGILFQCKLCNRNFLKKDVVQSHSCAKNRCIPKEEIVKKPNPPEPPKPPTVKYINTKVGSDIKKLNIPETTNSDDKTETNLKTPMGLEGHLVKPKPKIGPASKVKRNTEESAPLLVGTKTNSILVKGSSGRKQNVTCDTLNLPPKTNLNCYYKLVPGPNNTFTLVEEPITQETDAKTQKLTKNVSSESQNVKQAPKNRQSGNDSNYITPRSTNCITLGSVQIEACKKSLSTQPYPVGLIQTVSNLPSKPPSPPTTSSFLFSATPAQKQSYSIIQTGNPSKLVISAKPQQHAEEGPVKKIRNVKMSPHTQQATESAKLLSVTLDKTSRPLDPNMFKLLNIDPLLSPSYVLPINNESQAVTTNKDRSESSAHLIAGTNGHYTCNMCNEVFTREQKLLAHIHSHYNKLDEDDKIRVSKTNRKRARKS